MFHKVLVANRGAVAARVLRALKALGIRTVAVYSEADAGLPYLAMADEAHLLGPADPRESYLAIDKLLDIARRCGADGVHPGYGFLSENAVFAQHVLDAGMQFIGPSPRWIDAMGHKTRARELMARHGMPMGKSSELLNDDEARTLREAERIGYPVLVKPAGGGGGIGMLPARDGAELIKAVAQARSLAQRSFGNAELYLERLVTRPRHVEFQFLADRYGQVRHLFERDCSVQRRHQKVLEEAGAPGLPRQEVDATAARIEGILATLGYDVIGTAETLYDGENFNFLEMNTRLQVEHAVTEEVTGIDIVASQIRLAWGERIGDVLPERIELRGHAIEARVYAEDPVRFFPSPGVLKTLRLARGEGIRIETGYAEGCTVTPYYDPMIAKVIAHGNTREQARTRLLDALESSAVEGVKTNIPFIRQVLLSDEFVAGDVHTALGADVLARARHAAAAVAA
ncbi:acetyl/propionyl/methylcrotonyl-CoA carboxylase subunit alpha [Hydrogenophaga sp.]|uniref:acetyl-CoA carboxylase biotin carboxylase subunit n=1 Tax=Hydrogenophaga sp. TaxID=1904254 RepID=UPI002727149C|nr:biotin carboxylase N-terminal domain-containing protein [Hydrogenophaga sp.]MDO9435281.1 biotin carboxylase N-terminal domain-containing protein [Hydrogenophaga sp.]